MSVRYVATCDGCGQEKARASFDDWGRVDIRDPGVPVTVRRSYDFCSQDCLSEWWNQVAIAVDLGVPPKAAS